MNEEGIKNDLQKLRWDLIPIQELEEIVKVFDSGAKKYGVGNWKKIKNSKKRYFSAMMRHIVKWRKGEMYNNDDWNYHHLAHVAWYCITLMWFDRKRNNKNKIGVKINFSDFNFEQVIRTVINKPTGDIYQEDLLDIKKLDLFSKNIKSLQGIEFFTNLEELNCSSNYLTELDISKNVNLRRLDCAYNQLTELDISNNVNLKKFKCYNNSNLKLIEE